eukprot:gnl/Trimastix_PCT/1629.p1 GENE.gnl/Trimastix_PCT/1629~~gnl/Trimastix_PCT/1629.p1  ORF type:complete len:761 (+),score=266.01 gnl/Trimastix_PCT/1629:38-2320(+)
MQQSDFPSEAKDIIEFQGDGLISFEEFGENEYRDILKKSAKGKRGKKNKQPTPTQQTNPETQHEDQKKKKNKNKNKRMRMDDEAADEPTATTTTASAPTTKKDSPAAAPAAASASGSQTTTPAPKQAKKKNPKKKGKGKGQARGAAAPAAEVTPMEAEPFDSSAWDAMNLHPLLMQAIREKRFAAPMPIQERSIPAALFDGKDVLGAAETGSGKTLAFGIPIAQRILSILEDGLERPVAPGQPQQQPLPSEEERAARKQAAQGKLMALILTPTRELSIQVSAHLTALCKHTPIKVAGLVGGMALPKQRRLLAEHPAIVVGTPGRIWDLVGQGETHLADVSQLRAFVLDEADRMVEQGHYAELKSILAMVPAFAPPKDPEAVPFDPSIQRQSLIFSATLTTTAYTQHRKRNTGSTKSKLAQLLARVPLRGRPKIIDLTEEGAVAVKTLTQRYVFCAQDDKDVYLAYFLLRFPGRTIVFCNAISTVRRILSIMTLLQIPAFGLHAEMQQRQRLKNLDRFRDRTPCVLVATDVAARGLDIPSVDHVVHYQIPFTPDIFVHRSGRTARAGTEGFSVSFVTPTERKKYMKCIEDIPDVQSFPLDPMELSRLRKRVQLAKRIDVLTNQANKVKAQAGWFERQAEALEIDLDDSILCERHRQVIEDDDEAPRRKGRQVEFDPNKILSMDRLDRKSVRSDSHEVERLKQELATLNSREVSSARISSKYPTAVPEALHALLQARRGQTAETPQAHETRVRAQRKRRRAR